MTSKEEKESLAHQTIADLKSVNDFDEKKRSDSLKDLPAKERKEYKRELRETKARSKEAEADVEKAAAEALQNAQTAGEAADLYQATNDPQEEDGMLTSNTSYTPTPDITPADDTTPSNKTKEKLSDTGIQFTVLEAEIKDIRKQLKRIKHRAWDEVSKPILRHMNKILALAKDKLDLNQRYEKKLINEKFETDIRNPDDILAMLNDIQGKIEKAKSVWSAVLTGQPFIWIWGSQWQQWEAWEKQPWQEAWANNISQSWTDKAWITDNDNVKTSLQKMIQDSTLLESVWPRWWQLLKSLGKLLVAWAGLFTIGKTIQKLWKQEWKAAAMRWGGAALFYGLAPKKIFDLMGVEAKNIFGNLGSMKSWGGSWLFGGWSNDTSTSIKESSDAIINTKKEDLTPEKKQEIALNGTMLVGTPFCDMTLAEIQPLLISSGGKVTWIDYDKAKEYMNTKYGMEGGDFIIALTRLEAADKHAKTLGINIVADGLDNLWLSRMNSFSNPSMQNSRLIERFRSIDNSLHIGNEMISFYGFKDKLSKSKKIKEYFAGKSAELDKFTNEILKLPEGVRDEILGWSIPFDVKEENGQKYFVVGVYGMDFYIDLFGTVYTDNRDHKNQIGVKNKQGQVVFFDRRFGSYGSMIQWAFCLGKIMNKLRGNSQTTQVLQPRTGRQRRFRKDLVTADGQSIINESELPDEMKGAYMGDFRKYFDEDLSDRMHEDYADQLGIKDQLKSMNFPHTGLSDKLSSLVNQIVLENKIGASDIQLEYANHPNGLDKVLYINTFGQKNSVFLDVDTPNWSTASIIRVGHVNASTPDHLLQHTFSEWASDVNGGLNGALWLALLIGQCDRLQGMNHWADTDPRHRSGDQLQFSHGSMRESGWRWMMWLPEDKVTTMFDDKQSALAVKSWIPSLFDQTIFANAANGNKEGLTEFLNGLRTKDSAWNLTSESFWHEDEKKRASAFEAQMEKAAERIGIKMRPKTAPKPEDIKTINDLGPNGIEAWVAYIIPLNKSDYAGLETFRMIKFDPSEDGSSCVLNEVYFQPADKQLGSLGIPIPTDMRRFLEMTKGYLDGKWSSVAHGISKGVNKILSDGWEVLGVVYHDARDIVSTWYSDGKEFIKAWYQDIKAVIWSGHKWLQVLGADLEVGAEIVYEDAKEISKDALETLMRVRHGAMNIKDEKRNDLRAVSTLWWLNIRLKDNLDINLQAVIQTVVAGINRVAWPDGTIEGGYNEAIEVLKGLGIFVKNSVGAAANAAGGLKNRLDPNTKGEIKEYDTELKIDFFLADFALLLGDEPYKSLNDTWQLTDMKDALKAVHAQKMIKRISFDKRTGKFEIDYYEKQTNGKPDLSTGISSKTTLEDNASIIYPVWDATKLTVWLSSPVQLGKINTGKQAPSNILASDMAGLDTLRTKGEFDSIKWFKNAGGPILDQLIDDIKALQASGDVTALSYDNTKHLTVTFKNTPVPILMEAGWTNSLDGKIYAFI